MNKFQAVQKRWRAGWLGIGLSLLASATPAATLTWNGGVAGSWVNGSGGWLDGVSPANWNSATPDSALFGGVSAGSLTVDAGGVTVDDITVTNGAYAVNTGGVLTFSNTVFFINSALTTRVGVAVAGTSGLVKDGPGVLLFTNANKLYSGATVISGGAIRIHANAPGVLGATATQSVVLAGGALQGQFSANLIVSNRITVTTAGGELRNLGDDNQRWSIDGNRIAGTGTLTLAFGTSNTRFQMVTGQNDFFGKWVVDSGGNQNRYIDIFASSAFGGAADSNAITLINSGTLTLRDKITLGSASQGVLLGSGQSRIAVTDNSTAVVAAAISGPSTNALLLSTGSNTNSLMIISNAANSWLGETTLSGSGIVRLGLPGVFPDNGGNLVLNSTVQLDVNGQSEAIGGLFGPGRVDNRVAGAPATLTVGGNNNSPTFSGIITNSGAGSALSLVKVGTGTQTLSGTNTIAGFVRVEAGVLALSSAANLTASTSVTVEAGATLQAIGRSDGTFTVPSGQVLQGDGTIIGILTNNGVVAPGLPVGTLILTGNYSQAASGTLQLALAGTSSYDSLRSSGSAILGGNLDVTLDSFTPVTGDQFTLVRFTSRTGGFATTNLPSLSSGLGWTVTYLSTGVVLAVTGAPPVSGYGVWAAGITNGLTNYNESATNDGYPNLLKYATGSSPTNSDLLANLSAVRNGGTLSLVFNRNTNAVDVSLIVEGNSVLTNEAGWVGIATNVAGLWSPPVAVESGAGSPVSVTVPDGEAGAVSRFLRLRVTLP